ncbi:Transcription initiation factor TFIID subunit 12 [Fusarium equiseti]|uniref:Transcription initiation factor TFIID subunit 12 n=1 Tax=Fusarium equiseti TaxID=61235 RepID=A0ABQ8RIW8_FUSEQ|nr:Transcription initiation factor TFIID subunit 12 [Fusarium equiseti]
MNPQMGQQGQGQGQGQQQGAAGAAQPRPPPMYQPNQIRSLPTLSEDEKSKYEAGLQGLWNKANNSPQNSQEHIAARQKIIEFSKMLITKIQQRRTQMQNQNAQNQQARPQLQQNPSGQTTAQAQPQQQTAGAVTGNQAAGAAAQQNRIPEHILQHVAKINFRAPAQVAEKSGADANKWVEEIKQRYTRALMTMDNSKSKVAQIDKLIADRNAAGTPFKEDEMRQLQIRKDQQLKAHSDAHKWVDSVRKQQGNLQGTGQAQAQAAQNAARVSQQGNQQPATAQQTATQQPQAQAQQQQPQPQQQQLPQQQQQSQPQQSQPQAPQTQPQTSQVQNNAQNNAPPVNAAVEVAKQQLAAVSRASPVNGTPGAAPAQVRPAQGTPQPGQQQLPQAPVQVKQEPGTAPINPTMSQTAVQAQQTGTPTQQNAPRIPTPQQAAAAAAPTTAQGPQGPQRALSHSAAIEMANKTLNTPGSAQVPGRPAQAGTPTPGSAVTQGVMGPNVPQQPTPQGHPHAHPPQPQQTPMQSKMPIPKVLPEKATAVPQGVSVGGGVNAGRPTMSQGSGTLGGVMNQPAMARIPAYNHEAEGDHVLSKKKLDELVRQVCGGPAEGQDGNLLTPEVEENVLNMADSFVDSVLHAACRNSKERGSKVLEIRDIQLVLERTYNIRVPGYSSDELRTVRKIMPSTAWIAKMSAVQAAKVMPGKGE